MNTTASLYYLRLTDKLDWNKIIDKLFRQESEIPVKSRRFLAAAAIVCYREKINPSKYIALWQNDYAFQKFSGWKSLSNHFPITAAELENYFEEDIMLSSNTTVRELINDTMLAAQAAHPEPMAVQESIPPGGLVINDDRRESYARAFKDLEEIDRRFKRKRNR